MSFEVEDITKGSDPSMFRLRKTPPDNDDQASTAVGDTPTSGLDAAAQTMVRRQPPQLPSRPLTSSGYPSEYGRRPADPRSSVRQADSAAANAGGDRCLTIGRDVQLIGKVSACDQMTVDGLAEITLNGARHLRIGAPGHFKGHVDVSEADIAGRFEGELTVRAKLIVRATAQISGVIRYGHLVVEAGGQIAGEINGLEEEEGSETRKAPPQPSRENVTATVSAAAAPRRDAGVPSQIITPSPPIPSKV